MRPLLGELLASAGGHIDAATAVKEPLPEAAVRAVVRDLDRLAGVIAHCADGFTVSDEADPTHIIDEQVGAVLNARGALRHAAVSMHTAVGMLGAGGDDHAHPAAAHLSDAADYLAASHDLLQTHFAPGPFGSRHGRSEWAPVIVSPSVSGALLAELASYGSRVAGWANQLLGARGVDEALPAPARVAVNAACQWLRVAGAATALAGGPHLFTAAERTLLRAIPAQVAPARYPPRSGEAVPGLCMGIAHTAERLRYLTPAFAWRANGGDAGSAAGWQRTAQGAAVSGHCSELILRSLADRAGQLAMGQAMEEVLRQAADATGKAWAAWRAVARGWDTLTTATSRKLTPVAAEIGDLVLWVGRLAHTDPAWAPGLDHASAVRDPIGLATGHDGVVTVLAAVHRTGDTLASIAAHEREAVLEAEAHRRLYVPTRLLPARYDVPYRYALTPRHMADALLSTYDAASSASTDAAAALDSVAIAAGSPSRVLAAIRAANERGMPHIPHWDGVTAELSAVHPRPGKVERSLKGLGVSEPVLLERAAAIDQAARDLISQAKSKSPR